MVEMIDGIQIWKGLLSTGWMEWVSVFSQLLSVWYARQNKIWVYPTGLIGVLLAFYLYLWESKPPLYADAILNLYYGVMSVYGWYWWMQKRETEWAYPVRHAGKRERVWGMMAFVGGWVLIAWILDRFTDSNTPVMDAMVTASAMVGMWWMARRNIEHWLAWMVSNVVAIPLNVYKGFMLYAIMYLLLLGLAVWGWFDWKRKIRDHGAD